MKLKDLRLVLLSIATAITTQASAQITETCFSENFNGTVSGWTFSSGASTGNYNNPVNGCANDKGITTPGVGGNNPAKITTPQISSVGANLMRLSFDIFRMNTNLNCSSWADFGCPTSIDVTLNTGGNSSVLLANLVIPRGGPGYSPTVNVVFNSQGLVPNGSSFSLSINFKPKSGIGNCVQNATRYVIDNFNLCQITCNNCTIDALDYTDCDQANSSNVRSGNLATNNTSFAGATVSYSLANGPFANGSSTAGGADLTINSDGTFTITRTDLTKSVFDFTYRMTESVYGLSDLASVRVCFQEPGALPVTLVSFNCTRKNTSAILNWKTSSESNVAAFEIQRKVNNQFVTIGNVTPSNSAMGSTYSYIDNNSSRSVTEYRIRIVDINNTYRFSNVKTINGINTASDFTVFPNPSVGDASIEINDISNGSSISIFDYSGRKVKSFGNNNQELIKVTGLQNGIYMVQMRNDATGETITKKLVVNK